MYKKVFAFLLLFVFCCARPCASSSSFDKVKVALGQTSLAPNEEERLLEVPGKTSSVMFEITEFDEDTIKATISKLQEADAAGQQIYLRINTNGGSTAGMFTLTQAMEQLTRKNNLRIRLAFI